jgi:hypothetical protein
LPQPLPASGAGSCHQGPALRVVRGRISATSAEPSRHYLLRQPGCRRPAVSPGFPMLRQCGATSDGAPASRWLSWLAPTQFACLPPLESSPASPRTHQGKKDPQRSTTLCPLSASGEQEAPTRSSQVSLDEPPAEQGGVVLSDHRPSKVANQPRQEADGWQQTFLPISPEAPARNRIEHSSYGKGRRRTAFAQGQQTANPIALACHGVEDGRDSGFRRVEPAAFCHKPRAVKDGYEFV